MPNERERLLKNLERSVLGGAWHGPSAAEALEGITHAQAIAAPPVGSNTIAALTWHIAGWMEEVASRLQGNPPAEPTRGNFPDHAPPDEATWQQWKTLPAEALDLLREAIHNFPEEELDQESGNDSEAGVPWTYWDEINGITQHNTYHAGQIAILKQAR